jgi:CRP-like cAMP-binding protein
VVALTDSELCVFPKSEMGRAVELHPQLAQALLRRSQEDLLQSRELLALSGRRSARPKSRAPARPRRSGERFVVPCGARVRAAADARRDRRDARADDRDVSRAITGSSATA